MKLYKQEIKEIHRELGISNNYESLCGVLLHQEETELVEIGSDIYGRLQKLMPLAANAWKNLKTQAKNEGVILEVVSAFRAVDKQKDIIKRKLESGQPIHEILKVCAAPGYSEHHTGRALDLTTEGCEPLSEEFENTPAFSWLAQNADKYSFYLSYPKGNKAGISYEPWHWAYSPT